uniref:LAGLIDADG homing endonuclease n=1 Tax=Schizopora paradoxa TaxID=27342 RepID=A0A5B9RCN7_9AGAM|nr:LAGLIDADG homing endonuclease [Schizopora paradoxa]QEG57203.1 LAGLIDADG homing endonuclease [Schizopora paradoxa]
MALPYCEVGVTNLAICWNSCMFISTFCRKNLINNAKSAGNRVTLSSVTNSSETTRETSFNVTVFNHYYTKETGRVSLDINWLIWFIGFSEGDGAILLSKKNNIYRPRFVLTQKEGGILHHVRNTLGFGVVRHFPSGNYYRYIVEDNVNIRFLALLFNGNLVLPRRLMQLQAWLNVFKDIKLIESTVSPTLNDAWLSGFTDAEGCFNIAISSRKNTITGYRIILRFLLDQKYAEEQLLYIKNLFGFGFVSLRKETDKVYRYTNNSFKGLVSVNSYFMKYPLKTKKSTSFVKWNKAYALILKKTHLTKEGLDKIRILSREVNIINSETHRTGSAHP